MGTQTVSPSEPSASAASAAPAVGAARPTLKRRAGIALGVVVAVVVLVIGARWIRFALSTESTDDAYVNGHVTAVAPRVSGQVTRVLVDDNNRVKKGDLLVELDKEPYEIQLRLQQATLASAEADLGVAENQVRGIIGQARSNRFKLEHAIEDVRNQLALLRSRVAEWKVEQANLALAKADLARGESLIKTGAISKQQFDQFKASFDVAKNRVEASENAIQQIRASLGLPPNAEHPLDAPENLDQDFSTVRQALADLMESIAPLGFFPPSYNVTPKQAVDAFYKLDPEGNLDRIYAKLISKAPAILEAQAKLDEAKSNLDQAKLNLKWCDVVAEIDGAITRRNVNPGNNVQAGQGLMAIRSITEIWIDANFKETQLADMKIGHRAEIRVDLYGSRRYFAGRVSGFTMGTGSSLALLPAQNATGNFVKVVQRLPVRIELVDYKPEEAPLFVGLSVIPYVYIKEPPTGPDAGQVLQPPLQLPMPASYQQPASGAGAKTMPPTPGAAP